MLWLKSFHIIFMVTWMSGLFYLPRLFVYHAMSDDRISLERFTIMERKLYFGITTPGAILTLLTGFWLLYDYAWEAYHQQMWLHIKLGLVGLMVIYHVYLGRCWLTFKKERNTHSHIFYRILNEIPVFFLAAIVILVTVKP